MISKVEQAVADRLAQGLGRMVRTVKSYGGELDDLSGSIHALPAVWVAYGGSRIQAADTGGRRYREAAQFAVMCATRSLRSEAAGRHGGIDSREIGSNALVWAVRRLLDGQRLGFADSRGLVPQAVRPIANHALVQNAALSVAAVEYLMHWDSCPLEDGRFPEETGNPADADYVFVKYGGRLSAPYPFFERLDGLIADPQSAASVPLDVNLKKG